jgi:alpha/beta hydrolase fold
VPNGLVVGCESLFVPYGNAASAGHSSLAGWLFASTAAGAMAGDLVVGRFVPPGWRDQFIEPLRLLLAAPYLLFFLNPPPAAAVTLGFLAATGYAASLPLQDRLIRHTDDTVQGQVLGLHMNGMMTWQAIGAHIAGTVASFLPPATAMGTMAAASAAVTLLLVPGLRRSAPTTSREVLGWVSSTARAYASARKTGGVARRWHPIIACGDQRHPRRRLCPAPGLIRRAGGQAMSSEVETTTIAAGGGRELCVELAGEHDGTPILVHAGMPMSRCMYGGWIADAEKKGIRLIGYDRPGYGGSTERPGYTVSSAAQDVQIIAEALGHDRLGIWGISGGGPYALGCAALLPGTAVAVSAVASLAPYGTEGFDYFAGMGAGNAEGF